jgi:tocopherol O-methyltransferase
LIGVAERLIVHGILKGNGVIFPKQPQTTDAVAAHYDELDSFYRDIWGEHVHHGYWATGRETPAEAALSLIDLLAARLQLKSGQRVCDIGCGYGATARYLAEQYSLDVTGVTISTEQVERAGSRSVVAGNVSTQLQDWLDNGFAAESFDRCYAVESSKHMDNKQRFFEEAFRTLKPDGLFAVCTWLSRQRPRPWEVRYLLEPICREGRLAGLGDEAEYRRFAEQAGFRIVQVEDLSDRVSRTWWICIRRVLGKLVTQPRYLRFLLDRRATNRIFAVTLLRIMIAYRTRSMRYCLFVLSRETF